MIWGPNTLILTYGFGDPRTLVIWESFSDLWPLRHTLCICTQIKTYKCKATRQGRNIILYIPSQWHLEVILVMKATEYINFDLLEFTYLTIITTLSSSANTKGRHCRGCINRLTDLESRICCTGFVTCMLISTV